MNCKFRERVNGKLTEISPQDMEGRPFEGSCVSKIHDLFEAPNKHVRLIAYEFIIDEPESGDDDEVVFD